MKFFYNANARTKVLSIIAMLGQVTFDELQEYTKIPVLELDQELELLFRDNQLILVDTNIMRLARFIKLTFSNSCKSVWDLCP